MSSRRRKNPHPKRAVNARTVLKSEREEEPLVLCSRIPDEDDDLEAINQIQKEEEEGEDEGRRRRNDEGETRVTSDCEKVCMLVLKHMRTHERETVDAMLREAF